MSEKRTKNDRKDRRKIKCPGCGSADKVYETAKQYSDTHVEMYCDHCGYHWAQERVIDKRKHI